jgi:hypothetical protein
LIDGINSINDVIGGVYTFDPVVCAHTIVGKFEKVNLTITASMGTSGGNISPIGESVIPYGGSKAYTITALTGFLIDKVLIDGVNNPTAVSTGKYTFSNVTASHTIVANFKYRTYEITVTQGANGTITPGTLEIQHGDNMIYYFEPITGYMLKNVLIDGKNNAQAVAQGQYEFINVTAKHTVSATYVPITSAPATEESELSLYPNPTTGLLTINNGEIGMDEIHVFDMLGRKVMEYKVENEVTYKLDLSFLPGGIYFVRIKTETEMVMKKVVKN